MCNTQYDNNIIRRNRDVYSSVITPRRTRAVYLNGGVDISKRKIPIDPPRRAIDCRRSYRSYRRRDPFGKIPKHDIIHLPTYSPTDLIPIYKYICICIFVCV